jgi:signal transduction histidine kinase
LLRRYLQDSDLVHLVTAAADGTIQEANPLLARRLGKLPVELRGARLREHLTAADGPTLEAAVRAEPGAPTERLMLNFVDPAGAPFTLLCHLEVRLDGFTLLGEPPLRLDDRLQAELLQLTNELATLSRENARKGRALERALAELQQAQAMLVHREKMASLGQMTAGIAHEINNPLAYVASNHATLRRDFGDLLAFVQAVREALPGLAGESPDLLRRLRELADEADLDYLVRAVPGKLEANLDGLERVKQLVLDLRTFARLDEADVKSCDLGECLRSVLRFLGPLAREHAVNVELGLGALPPILCRPATLNQAVSNLVANAIQASRPGQTVRVETQQQGADAVITVRDQGGGIAPEHLARVFDPFFTTKPLGQGTGLGLSIAHQVVASHGGKIEIESNPGCGTMVRVRVPLEGAQALSGSGHHE